VQAAIDALVDQTKSIERAVAALKLDAIVSKAPTASTRPTRSSSEAVKRRHGFSQQAGAGALAPVSPRPEMLICHCNLITEKEIEQTILELLEPIPGS
jgi:hypothetical protein